ncbi:MAG: hypothetical protein M2R45_01123 [Verrucomicrobia subdivision 3 bacterium]|nr:hypothetical protein [Limisphaerales bacterium]
MRRLGREKNLPESRLLQHGPPALRSQARAAGNAPLAILGHRPALNEPEDQGLEGLLAAELIEDQSPIARQGRLAVLKRLPDPGRRMQDIDGDRQIIGPKRHPGPGLPLRHIPKLELEKGVIKTPRRRQQKRPGNIRKTVLRHPLPQGPQARQQHRRRPPRAGPDLDQPNPRARLRRRPPPDVGLDLLGNHLIIVIGTNIAPIEPLHLGHGTVGKEHLRGQRPAPDDLGQLTQAIIGNQRQGPHIGIPEIRLAPRLPSRPDRRPIGYLLHPPHRRPALVQPQKPRPAQHLQTLAKPPPVLGQHPRLREQARHLGRAPVGQDPQTAQLQQQQLGQPALKLGQPPPGLPQLADLPRPRPPRQPRPNVRPPLGQRDHGPPV